MTVEPPGFASNEPAIAASPPSITLGGANWLTRSSHYLRIISAELGHKTDSTGFSYLRFNAVFGLQLLQKLGRIQVRVQNCVLPLDG